MPRLVSTGVLASDLGVTERRVQQMVAEFILPPPRDGRHDRDLCAQRFRLFRDPEGDGWDRFQRDAEADAADAEHLVEAACAAGSTTEAVTAASLAHQAAMAALRFIAVVGFRRNEPARHLALRDIERMDGEATGWLLHRGLEILAEQSGITLEEAKAKLVADCGEPEPSLTHPATREVHHERHQPRR